MSLYADVRALAAAIRLGLPPTEIGDTEAGVVICIATARITEMARRDWAVRVLRELAHHDGFANAVVPYDDTELDHSAQNGWRRLPESVRAELGERP